ncbi:hypothetical protein BDZ89DRAFT_1148226 [Hymenopellis radicata]|nr:hypothetical protein BDZ89DRAFT_1148226 [Hymenopellis radicata]
MQAQVMRGATGVGKFLLLEAEDSGDEEEDDEGGIIADSEENEFDDDHLEGERVETASRFDVHNQQEEFHGWLDKLAQPASSPDDEEDLEEELDLDVPLSEETMPDTPVDDEIEAPEPLVDCRRTFALDKSVKIWRIRCGFRKSASVIDNIKAVLAEAKHELKQRASIRAQTLVDKYGCDATDVLIKIMRKSVRPQYDVLDIWTAPKSTSPPSIYIATHRNLNELRPLFASQSSIPRFPSLQLSSVTSIIDLAEHIRICQWVPDRRGSFAGCWVLLRGGRYNADVGWVEEDAGGQWLNVRVVPRVEFPKNKACHNLEEPADDVNDNGKRRLEHTADGCNKRTPPSSVRPSPRLLGDQDRKRMTLVSDKKGYQKYRETGGLLFATDIAVIRYRRRAVSLALVTPQHVHSGLVDAQDEVVRKACHTLPPLECWVFQVNEPVRSLRDGRNGIVTRVDTVDASVSVSNISSHSLKHTLWIRWSEELEGVEVSVKDIIRVFTVGDVVLVHGVDGECGHGWVIDADPPKETSSRIEEDENGGSFKLVEREESEFSRRCFMKLLMHLPTKDNESVVPQVVRIHKNNCVKAWREAQDFSPDHTRTLLTQKLPHATMAAIDMPPPDPVLGRVWSKKAAYSGQIPWFRRRVYVHRGMHKGRMGTVEDAKVTQETMRKIRLPGLKNEPVKNPWLEVIASGIHVYVRFEVLRGGEGGALQKWVDYDDAWDAETYWPLRVVAPCNFVHTRAGFNGNPVFYQQELGSVFHPHPLAQDQRHARKDRTVQVLEADLVFNRSANSETTPGWWNIDEDDRAAGSSRGFNTRRVAYNDDIPWCLQPYLRGLNIVVPLPGSTASKERCITIRQIQADDGTVGVYRVKGKGKLDKQALAPSTITAKHPGQKPADGHCWFIFKNDGKDYQIGTFVRPIRLIKFETETLKELGWDVAVVRRGGKGKPDEDTGDRLYVLDEHLLILQRPSDWKLHDAHFLALREKTRQGSRQISHRHSERSMVLQPSALGQPRITSFFVREPQPKYKAVLMFFSEFGLQTVTVNDVGARLRLVDVHPAFYAAGYMPPAKFRILQVDGASCVWRKMSHLRSFDVAWRGNSPIFFDGMPDGMALPADWMKEEMIDPDGRFEARRAEENCGTKKVRRAAIRQAHTRRLAKVAGSARFDVRRVFQNFRFGKVFVDNGGSVNNGGLAPGMRKALYDLEADDPWANETDEQHTLMFHLLPEWVKINADTKLETDHRDWKNQGCESFAQAHPLQAAGNEYDKWLRAIVKFFDNKKNQFLDKNKAIKHLPAIDLSKRFYQRTSSQAETKLVDLPNRRVLKLTGAINGQTYFNLCHPEEIKMKAAEFRAQNLSEEERADWNGKAEAVRGDKERVAGALHEHAAVLGKEISKVAGPQPLQLCSELGTPTPAFVDYNGCASDEGQVLSSVFGDGIWNSVQDWIKANTEYHQQKTFTFEVSADGVPIFPDVRVDESSPADLHCLLTAYLVELWEHAHGTLNCPTLASSRADILSHPATFFDFDSWPEVATCLDKLDALVSIQLVQKLVKNGSGTSSASFRFFSPSERPCDTGDAPDDMRAPSEDELRPPLTPPALAESDSSMAIDSNSAVQAPKMRRKQGKARGAAEAEWQ